MKEYFEYWWSGTGNTILTIRYSNKAYLYNPSELDMLEYEEWVAKLSEAFTFSAKITPNGFDVVIKEQDVPEIKEKKLRLWNEFSGFYEEELQKMWMKKKDKVGFH